MARPVAPTLGPSRMPPWSRPWCPWRFRHSVGGRPRAWLRSQAWYSSAVSFLREQRVWQLLDEGFDLVAHPHVMAQGFLRAPGPGSKPRRVVKASVDDPGAAGKDRAGLMGIATDGNHVIEGKVLHHIQGFRLLR